MLRVLPVNVIGSEDVLRKCSGIQISIFLRETKQVPGANLNAIHVWYELSEHVCRRLIAILVKMFQICNNLASPKFNLKNLSNSSKKTKLQRNSAGKSNTPRRQFL